MTCTIFIFNSVKELIIQ